MKKLPGFIELLRAPEGPGSGGGSEPTSSGSGDSTSTTPAPATTGAPGGPPAQPSSPSGASAKTSPASPAAPEAPEPLGDDPFSGFGADDSGDEAPTPTPKETAAPTEAKPAEAQTPPAETPKPSEQPQAPPTAAPPAQTGPQEAVPQLPSPAEPARMASVLLGDIEAFSEHLAQQPEFKLSEADIEAINNDVITAIPKLMARTFVRAQASALSQMDRVIPAMVERYMKVSKAREASEGKFYARWPSISKAEHGTIVDRLAQTYRKENPQASLQQMVEELGPLVMMVAKITPTSAAQPNGAGGSPGATPTRKPPATPFQPAVGGSASPPAPSAPPDAWSGYGAQEDE